MWWPEGHFTAKPIGSFSLSGQTMKFSAIKETVDWPWAVCDNCKRESRGKHE